MTNVKLISSTNMVTLEKDINEFLTRKESNERITFSLKDIKAWQGPNISKVLIIYDEEAVFDIDRRTIYPGLSNRD